MSDGPGSSLRLAGVRTGRLIVCVLALASAAASAAAQRVDGRVVDAPSGLGVASAVVTQLDARGQALARALSGAGGRFTLDLDANARSIRVVRLGYVARSLALREWASGDIVLQRIPQSMEPVRVAARGCPVRADTRQALALLDQARDGLLAAVVSRDGEPVAAVRLRFEREVEGDGQPDAQRVWIDSTSGTHTTFATAPSGAELAERGFLEDIEGRGLVMHAPDADVFLDDAFVNAYCFHVARPSVDRPRQVGLGFSPSERGRRRGRVDVEGTVWVDTAMRELREAEFRYVGLPREIAALRPGGHVTFLALSNGLVLVDRWQLRLVGSSLDTVPGFVDRGQPVVRIRMHVSETGGEVAAVQWSGNAYEARLGALSIAVQTSDSQPAAGVLLHLDGTDYRATTDSAGRARMGRLLPGPYRLVVLDPRLAPIDLPLETGVRFDAWRDSVHVATFTRPMVPPAMLDHCASRRVVTNSPRDTIPWIIGRVRRSDGGLIEPGTIRVRKEVRTGWWEPVGATFRVGTDGLFWICSAELVAEAQAQVEYQVRGGRVHRILVALRKELTVVPLEIDP